MYKLRRNTTYTESINTLNNREDQNFEENKGETRQTGVQLREMQQRYMKENREIEEDHLAQQTSWLLNNAYFAMI